MNFNMTFKQFLNMIPKALLRLILPVFLLLAPGITAYAGEDVRPLYSADNADAVSGEITVLPEGDILLIYSDGADAATLASVRRLIESLTFLNIGVVYGEASDCLGQLERFDDVICYRVEQYPQEILAELLAVEQKGRLLFIGNNLLRDFLIAAERSGWFRDIGGTVGKCIYSFNAFIQKQSLVEEKNIIFLTNRYSGFDTDGPDLLDYTSGSVMVGRQEGYFCATRSRVTHIPVTDMNTDLVRAALNAELSRWCRSSRPVDASHQANPVYSNETVSRKTYSQYIVLDEIYPFQNPEELLVTVEELVKRNTPFVLSVMPMYQHGEYPAMKRFCEVLRYAQSQGGTVVLHGPIHQMSKLDVELINEYLGLAIGNYLAEGVYPMGILVPRNWMFNPEGMEILSRFHTILVTEEEDPYLQTELGHSNLIFQDGHQWIAPVAGGDMEEISEFNAFESAVYLKVTGDMEELAQKLEVLRTSYVPIGSLWDKEHSLWTDRDTITYQNDVLLVNRQRTELNFVPEDYEEEFEYRRNMLQRFSKDLTEENQTLLTVVLGVSSLFLIFIFLARRNNKNRFLIKHGETNVEDYLDNLTGEPDKLKEEAGSDAVRDSEQI